MFLVFREIFWWTEVERRVHEEKAALNERDKRIEEGENIRKSEVEWNNLTWINIIWTKHMKLYEYENGKKTIKTVLT
jgi:hypothetical protein